jgi:filamentous hemagglutinin family protein
VLLGAFFDYRKLVVIPVLECCTRFEREKMKTSRARHRWWVSVIASLIPLSVCEAGQIVLDGKLGTSGSLAGPNFTIPASAGKTVGKNLFHSFSQFDLESGDIATFYGPGTPIKNVLARVTGGSASSIDGTIQTDPATLGGANFFLINPHGIIFGPNAALDVSGSFAATTANYLKLAGGARFVASLGANDSHLTTAPVSAFGFMDGNAGSISVNASGLTVPAGKVLSLAGGDISIDGGKITAPGGRVNLVSVKSKGNLKLNANDLDQKIDASAFAKQGVIEMQDSASIHVSGEGGGRVSIRGGQLVMGNTGATPDNTVIEGDTTGNLDGRGIDVVLTGDMTLQNGALIQNSTLPGTSGDGGSISIMARNVDLNQANIETENQFDSASKISSFGNAGNIEINTKSLNVIHSDIESITYGSGTAGDIHLAASFIVLDRSELGDISGGSGNGGDIRIEHNSYGKLTLKLIDGADISLGTGVSGNGGAVDINAYSVVMNDGEFEARGSLGAQSESEGHGGDIRIKTKTFKMDGGDFLTSTEQAGDGGSIHIMVTKHASFSNGQIDAETHRSGRGGDVDIEAGSMKLSNFNIITKSDVSSTDNTLKGPPGDAGNISIRVRGTLRVNGTFSSDSGALDSSANLSNAGNINVLANVFDFTSSPITTSAPKGGGGNIQLSALGKIHFIDSKISSDSGPHGGNISLGPPLFVFDGGFGGILDNSSIKADASPAVGDVAGNITLGIGLSFINGSTKSAVGGVPGIVTVDAPETDLSGSVVELAGVVIDAQSQLQERCGMRLTGGLSSFIVVGAGGSPVEPTGFLPGFELNGKSDHPMGNH